MLIGDPANNRMTIRVGETPREIDRTYLLAAGNNINRIQTKVKELLDPHLAPYGYEIYIHLFAMPTETGLNTTFWLKCLTLPYVDNWWVPREL